jgi:hypothetical protein
MKNTKTTIFYLLIALILNFHTVNSQNLYNNTNINSKKDIKLECFKNKVGFSAGLLGIDFIYSRTINDRLSARIDASFFNKNFSLNNKFDFGGQKGDVDLDIKNNTLNLDLEYLPFKYNKSIKFIVGLNYLYNFQLNSTTVPLDGRNYGDISITPSEIGVFKTQIKWLGLEPYIGIGYETSIYKQLSFGMELGTTFIPYNEIKFSSTGMLTPMSKLEQEEFRNWVGQFLFMPNLKVSLSYRFGDPKFILSKNNK